MMLPTTLQQHVSLVPIARYGGNRGCRLVHHFFQQLVRRVAAAPRSPLLSCRSGGRYSRDPRNGEASTASSPRQRPFAPRRSLFSLFCRFVSGLSRWQRDRRDGYWSRWSGGRSCWMTVRHWWLTWAMSLPPVCWMGVWKVRVMVPGVTLNVLRGITL